MHLALYSDLILSLAIWNQPKTEYNEEKHNETVTVETVEIDDKNDNLNWVDVVGSDQLKKAVS